LNAALINPCERLREVQARDDPSMIDGSHCFFCSSVSCLTIECRQKMLMCTAEHAAKAPAERPTSAS
jgi:hypothetical protein